jgi:23S rRNA pseudouridine2604 synthase
MEEKSRFPMRINKYLALKQFATRRGADELILRNKVLINGKLAKLGDKVTESDVVEVKGTKHKQTFLYFIHHKNKAGDLPTFPPGVRPLVTLGEHDTGLMLYTNDGRITDVVTNPETSPEKEYVVKTQTPIRANFKDKMEHGVEFDDFVSGSCRVAVIDETTFVIALREQKKNQVRRMCSALHTEVASLHRTRIANLAIGPLHSNTSRPVKGDELEAFLKALGF